MADNSNVMEQKGDAWKNTMTGLGMKRSDKTEHTHFGNTNLLLDTELAALHVGDGIGAAIVDTKAEDATHNGYTITGDPEQILATELDNLKTSQRISEAMIQSRLFGGSVILMDIADGKLWSEPYTPLMGRPAPLRSLRVYPRTRIRLSYTDIIADPSSQYFEGVELYNIRKLYGGEFQVHASRLVVFRGIPAPDIMAQELTLDHRFWGLSVLQKVYTHLGNLGSMLQGLGIMGQEFSIGKLKLSNLSRLVAENNFKGIETRMEAIALQKSLLKMVLLGEGEDFQRDNLGGTGLDTIVDKLFKAVASASGYPEAILFGKAGGGGLNTNQEEDTRRYYDSVTTLQHVTAQPALKQIAFVANTGLGNIVDPAELSVKWNAPWVMSETQQVQNRKTQMEIDKGYVEMGAYNGNDVAINRFKNGYSYETKIEGVE